MSQLLAFANFRTQILRSILPVAAAEIAVGAIMINNTIFNFNVFFVFNALGVAAASLTFLTIPVMLWVSRYRKGSFITMISVEAGWTFILWVLWLAGGADAANTLPDNACILNFSFINLNNGFFLDDTTLCNQNRAFIGLSFLGWIILFFYNMSLLFLVARQQSRGHTNIWSGQIMDTDFSAPGPNTSSVMYSTEAKITDGANGSTMPQVPHQYPPVTSVQDGGYVGQPIGAMPNATPLTGTTAASSHLPEV